MSLFKDATGQFFVSHVSKTLYFNFQNYKKTCQAISDFFSYYVCLKFVFIIVIQCKPVECI